MMNLQQLEATFKAAIFDGPKNNNAIKALQSEIKSKKNLTVEQQLAIYRDSALGGIVNALAQIYPVCKKLLGKDFFDAMATQYVYQQPFNSPDIGDTGKKFALFIKQFAPAKQVPYLTDVARLEWYWHKAFHAKNSTPINLQSLAQLTTTQQQLLRFHLNPSIHLLSSCYPVDTIWQMNQPDKKIENIKDERVHLLIWRCQLDMQITRLNKPQWQFLNALSKAQTFTSLCEHLVEQNPTINIPSLTTYAVQQGWITSFTLE